MGLTDILLLIIVIAGAVYVGYLLGRRAALEDASVGARPSAAPPASSIESPLPGPRESFDAPRRSTPPPATAGGTAAGGAASSPGPQAGGSVPRRTAAPPPARAGLLDPGTASGSGEGAKPSKKRS
ncbi:MAG: hypothetical protein ACT4N2_07865 [Hyphomicrobium sp.]